MTPEEITAMAREAGFGRNGFSECLVRGSRGVWIDVQDEVNRLVALVAEKAAAKEREACALVCESERVEYMELSAKNNGRESDFAFGSVNSAERIAAAIRARGQKGGV